MAITHHTLHERVPSPGEFDGQPPGRLIGDRGALAVELVAAFAIWIVVMLYLVQFTLWWHAKATLDTAAQQAVTAASLTNAAPNAGYDAANSILSQTGHLSSVSITVNRGSDTVSVDLTGTSPALVPFGSRQVRAHAEAPLERFVPRTERP
jgi:hypothetical protein